MNIQNRNLGNSKQVFFNFTFSFKVLKVFCQKIVVSFTFIYWSLQSLIWLWISNKDDKDCKTDCLEIPKIVIERCENHKTCRVLGFSLITTTTTKNVTNFNSKIWL